MVSVSNFEFRYSVADFRLTLVYNIGIDIFILRVLRNLCKVFTINHNEHIKIWLLIACHFFSFCPDISVDTVMAAAQVQTVSIIAHRATSIHS